MQSLDSVSYSNNISECYHEELTGYYLDTNNNIFKQCNEKCSTCSLESFENGNLCTSCNIESNYLILSFYSIHRKQFNFFWILINYYIKNNNMDLIIIKSHKIKILAK